MLVADEPGIGKSRLAAELEKRLHAEPHLRLRYFCSPYDHESALYPVVDQTGRAAGFANDNRPKVRLEKLASLLLAPRRPTSDLSAYDAYLRAYCGPGRRIWRSSMPAGPCGSARAPRRAGVRA